ncbi:MAG: hypothetical protein JRH10_16625, partial [Deltaproteobacteria bacterium]|nr:hypothetical protein [Deltaproteobacteria bacterium]
ALVLAAPAGATTVLIDFEAFDGTPGLGWNMIDAADSGSVIDLLDDTGIDSGWDLTMPTVTNNAGVFDAWNDANALPAWAPDSAADDYVYFNLTNTNFDFTGLDPLLTYDIDIVVSRDLSRSQDHRIVVPGPDPTVNNWDSQTDGYTAGNTIRFTGITPDLAGRIRLRIHRDGTSAALNAIRIVSVPGPPGALLVASSVALLAVAVRRR